MGAAEGQVRSHEARFEALWIEQLFDRILGMDDEAGGAHWSAVAGLAELPPGPQLALRLQRLVTDELSAAERVVVLQGWERLKSWCEGGQLSALAELAEQPEYERCSCSRGEAHEHDAVRAAGTEVSLALLWSPNAACERVALALELHEAAPAVLSALCRGVLDFAKARVILDGTRCLSDFGVRWSVVRAAVAKAPELTAGQLCRWLPRVVIAADPAQAADRRRAGVERRRVSRPEPYSIDAAAGIAEMIVTGPAEDLVALSTALDAAARAARGAGDDRTHAQLRFDTLAGLAWVGLDLGHLGCCNSSCGTGHARRLATGHGRAAAVQVTVPIDTLAGGSHPAALDGYGPIPAEAAREVAGRGIMHRLLTEPADGRVLEYGRTAYAAPRELTRLVAARDVTCRLPTCSVPARRCDLDHKRPFADGGDTGARNMWPLCRGHHLDKTHHGFELEIQRVNPGRDLTYWRTPAGQLYRVAPEEVGLVERPPAPSPPDPDPPPF